MIQKGLKVSKNPKDTEKIAKVFLVNIFKKNLSTGKYGNKKATVVGLYGELGAGKTAFTKAIAKAVGIKKKVSSPTFVIMKKYPIKSENYKFLFHLDAYRLKNAKELLHLGWEEIISNPEHLVFIEWPENVKKAMPKNHCKVQISHLPRLASGKAGTKEGHRDFKIKV